ncbi:MAG: hypothetical protein M4579_003207 [Chaenotheca gracillima]|nr:MAG: hypothetical protein M4579_003207 [Chaenotheca gracillima]
MLLEQSLRLPPQVVAAGVVVVITIVIKLFFLPAKIPQELKNIPLVGGEDEQAKAQFVKSGFDLLQEGYRKYPDGAFRVWTPNGFVVLISRRFIDELKNLPEDQADFYSANEEMVLSKYTRIERDPLIVDTIKNDLTGNLGLSILLQIHESKNADGKNWKTAKVMPAVIDEASYAVSTELPQGNEWESFPVYHKATRIIALIAGRAFLGLPINRNEDWIKSEIEYPADVFHGAFRLKKYPSILRPFVYRALPEFQRIFAHYAQAQRLILPVLKERAKAWKNGSHERPNDVMQYEMENARGDVLAPFHVQAKSQITAALGTIHTSSGALTHSLFDLASRPEYQQPLREEVLAVLKEEGGTLEKKAMNKLKKLDSFLKESLRLNPPNQIAFLRRALTKIVLSDGTIIPKGTFFAVPSGCISLDPMVWKNATEFDGFRFSRLRDESSENANRYQFVTISFDSLHFGYGRHACPGRFFASNQIKTVLALLVKDYDLSLEEGQTERPANITTETQVLPNMTESIRMRKRA